METKQTVPGAYRELFKTALRLLLEAYDVNDYLLTPQQCEDARHYLALLDNPSYKFGKVTYHGGSLDETVSFFS